MNAALELVRAVEANGGRLRVEDGWLVIAPGNAAGPVIEELRQHKAEIIDLLAQRPAMPAGCRLVSYAPKEPPIKLTAWETITDTQTFVRATLTQIDERLHGRGWLANCWTLSTLLDRLAAVGCIVALENKERTLQ